MNSLLIETSSERGCISLFEDKKTLYYKALPFGFQNSKNLFPEIREAFKVVGISLSSLQLIIVGVGPGSYTGMRISAMAAKSLSFSLKVPLVGVCSLTGFIPDEEGVFASIIDAKTGGIYLQTALLKDGKVTVLKEAALYSLESALSIFSEVKTIVTPNGRLLKPKLERLGVNVPFLEKDPNAFCMFMSGFSKFKDQEFSVDTQLDLLYLR